MNAKRLGFSAFRRLARALAGRGLGLHSSPRLMSLYHRLYEGLRPGGCVLIDVHGCKMFYDTNLKSPLDSLVVTGTYEVFETELFLSLIRPGMVVLDVGANIGYYTLLAAKALNGSGHVISFEPDPRNFSLLSRTIEYNRFQNVSLFEQAVADHRDVMRLFADGNNSGASSLSRDNVQLEDETYQVEVTTLDTVLDRHGWLPDVGLVKLDVQGAEGLVIAGAHQLLQQPAVKMMMEFEPPKLQSFGTDPRELLEKLLRYSFRIQLIETQHKVLREAGVSEIVEACRAEGYMNLLLTKA